MSGILERAQGVSKQPEEGMPSGGFDHSEELRKMVSVMPPQIKKAFEQLVKAGTTIMYSPETREEILNFVGQEAPIEEILGMGAANLVILVDNQANGNIPKEAMVPAATVLLFDLADVMKQSGETISAEQIGKAYEIMFYGIFAGYGMEPGQVDQVFDQIGGRK